MIILQWWNKLIEVGIGWNVKNQTLNLHIVINGIIDCLINIGILEV